MTLLIVAMAACESKLKLKTVTIGGASRGGGPSENGELQDFSVLVKGKVYLRSDGGAKLVNRPAGAGYQVEAMLISNDRVKTRLLQSAVTGQSGDFSLSLAHMNGDDVLLVAAFSEGLSSGQALIPVKNYLMNLSETRLLEINIDVDMVQSIAAWVLIKRNIPLPDGLTPQRLERVQRLVQDAIAKLGKEANDKSTIEIAEALIESREFVEQLDQIFGQTAPRDVCEQKAWDFLQGRQSIESIFGSPDRYTNLPAEAKADNNGIYQLAPSLFSGGELRFYTSKVQDPVQGMEWSVSDSDFENEVRCFDRGTRSFSAACSAPVVDELKAGSWSVGIPVGALKNGHLYTASLRAVDLQCDTVVSEAEMAFLWDGKGPELRITNAPDPITTASSLNVKIEGATDDFYSFSLRSGSAASDCNGITDYSVWRPLSIPITPTGLSDGAKRLCVRGRDSFGNVAETPVSYAWVIDTTAPIVGGSGALGFSAIGANQFTVSWAAASDATTPAADITYAVYRSDSANIGSAAAAKANGSLVTSGKSLTAATLTALSAGETYYVNIVATDALGQARAYVMASQATSAGGGPVISQIAVTSATLNQDTATCGTITIETQDGASNPVAVGSNTTLALASTAGTGVFYSDALCTAGNEIAQATVSNGTSGVTVFYKQTATGVAAITVAEAPSAGWTDGSVSANVTAGPVTELLFTNSSLTQDTNACGTLTVALRDGQGNFASAGSAVTIDLATTGPSGVFYANALCSGGSEISQATILAGDSDVTFYYQDTDSGSPTLSASENPDAGWTDASQGAVINAGAIASLVYTTASLAMDTTACGSITVELRDGFGNVVSTGSAVTLALGTDSPAGTFYSDASCTGGNEINQASISGGASTTTYYYRDTQVGTPTVTAAETPSSSWADASQSATITVGPITKVVFTSVALAQNVTACGALTVEAQDAGSNAATVGADTVLDLSTSSGTGTFYSDASCTSGNELTAATITNGNPSVTFYYQDTAPGTPTLGAAENPDAGWTDASQGATISAGSITKLIVTSSALNQDTTACGAITVETQDAANNPTAVGADTTIDLGTDSGTGTFYSDASCTGGNEITQATITNATSSATVYYRDTTVGSPSLSFVENPSAGWTDGSQSASITVGPTSKLVFTNAALSQNTSACGTLKIEAQDNASNRAMSANAVVDLSTSSGTGTFYSDSSCTPGNEITVATITSGIVTFFYQDTAAGTPTLGAAENPDAGWTDASQGATISAGSITKSVVTSPVLNQDTVSCGAITIETQDAANNPTAVGADTTFDLGTDSGTGTFYSDASCTGGNEITQVTISNATSSATVYYRDTTVGSPSLSFVENPSAGWTDGSQSATITPGPISELVFTNAALSQDSSACGSLTVEIRDAQGNTATAGSNITLDLTTSSVSGVFYTNGLCSGGSEATQIDILAGDPSVTYYYQDTASGTPTLTVSENPSAGYTDATQSATISAGAVTQLVFTTTALTQDTTACGTVTIAAEDAFGNPVVVGADVDLTLSTDSARGDFFSDNACTGGNEITTATIGTGTSNVTVYYRDLAVGTPTVSADESPSVGYAAASQGATINAGPVAQLAFTSSALSQDTAACGTLTVKTQDIGGNDVTVTGSTTLNLSSDAASGTFYSDASCTGGNEITDYTLNVGEGAATFYYRDISIGSPTLTVAESPDAGWTDASQGATITTGAISKLVFTTAPLEQDSNTCGQLTVEARDAGDNPASVGSDVILDLATNSALGVFYSNALCSGGSEITQATILGGDPSVTFYYQDPTAGALTLTASENPDLGWADASQGATIKAGAITQLAFTSATLNQDVTACGTITVETQDLNGNAKPVATDVDLALATTSSSGTFYSDSACTGGNEITLITMANGSWTVTYYYRDTTIGTPTLTADENPSVGYAQASQTATITGGPITALVFTSTSLNQTTDDCGMLTIETQDTLANAIAVSADTLLNLTSDSGNGTFFSDSSCTAGNEITQATIGNGTATVTVYYRDATVGGPTLTADETPSVGYTAASQGATITAGAITQTVVTTPALSLTAGQCGAMTIETRDALGNAVAVGADTTFSLSSTAGTGTFYSDAGCASSQTDVVMTNGTSTATFYYSDTTAGTPTLSAAESPDQGWSDASQGATISGADPVTEIGAFGGRGADVAVVGTTAYVAKCSRGLEAYDVTSATAPVYLDRYDTTGCASAVTIVGDLAYVADDTGGLVVIDVSDPTDLAQRATLDTAGQASDVVVVGDYAYVGDNANGLLVIDVYHPSSPTLVGSYDTPGGAIGVAVNGNYAFVADNGNNLLVIDVTDPTAPSLATQLDTGDLVKDVFYDNSYLYLANYNSGMTVVNVSNPLSPVIVATANTPGQSFKVFESSGYVYLGDYGWGLSVVDATTPTSPTYLTSVDTRGTALGVAALGGYAYLADDYAGLHVFDVSVPASANLVGKYDTASDSRDLQVVGSTAYVADGNNGLTIVDVTSAAKPTLIGTFKTDLSLVYPVREVEVRGSYVYAAADNTGLRIIDVTDPASPSLTGYYSEGAYIAYGLEVSGSTAYVAFGTKGLTIFNVSTPSSPTVTGVYDTAGTANQVVLVGTTAYVADGTNGLVIVNVSSPAAPTLVGSYDTAGNAFDVAVSGNYAFIADYSKGVIVVDISNPAAPTYVTQYSTPYISRLALQGSNLFVGGSVTGVIVLDVTDPTNPVESMVIDTAGVAGHVVFDSSYAYLADGSNGIGIYAGFPGLDGTRPAVADLDFIGSPLDQAVSTCGAMTLQAQNVNGNPEAVAADLTIDLASTSGTGQFHDNPSCSSPITQAVITGGTSSTIVYYQDTTVGTPVLSAAETPSTGLTDASMAVRIKGPPITKTVFTGAALSQDTLACGLLTIETQSSGSVASLAEGNVVYNLSTDSPTGAFYSDAGCSDVITQVTIARGSATISFYYQDTTVGTPSMTAVEAPSQGWTDASTSATISASPITQLVFTNAALNQLTGQCGALAIESRNAAGTATPVSGAKTILLASTSGTGTFYNEATCSAGNEITQTTIADAGTSATFYYSDTASSTATLTASESPSETWTDATQTADIAAGAAGAPTPNPMSFAAAPSALDATRVSMTATTATDPDGVQYQFVVTPGPQGAASSPWLAATSWTATGLSPNTAYEYKVKARDLKASPDETAASSPSTAYTPAATPAAPALRNPTASSVDVFLNPNGNPTDAADWSGAAATEFAVLCTAPCGNKYLNPADGSQSASEVWATYADWGGAGGKTVAGFGAATTYQMQVKARDRFNVETGLSATGAAAPASGPSASTIDTSTIGTIKYRANVPVASTTPTTLELGTDVSTNAAWDAKGDGKTLIVSTSTKSQQHAHMVYGVLPSNIVTLTQISATMTGGANGEYCPYYWNFTTSQWIAFSGGCVLSTTVADRSFTATTGLSDLVTPGGLYIAAFGQYTAGGGAHDVLISDFASITFTGTRDTVPPADVGNFVAATTGAPGEIKLSWTLPTDPDLRTIWLVRKAGSVPTSIGDGTKLIGGFDTTSVSKVDSGLSPGTVYYYKMFAQDSHANWSSGVTPTGNGIDPADAPPPDVTDLQAAASSTYNKAIDFTWVTPAIGDLAGIRILRKTTNDITNATDATATVAADGLTGSSVSLGVPQSATTYYFKVFVQDSGGVWSSGVSVAGSAATLANSAPVLDAVTDVTTLVASPLAAVDAGNDGGDDFDANGEPITYSCYFDTTDDDTVAQTTACSNANIANGTGFSFNTATGIISGWTPADAGTYEFMIEGCDDQAPALCDSVIFTVIVSAAPPKFVTVSVGSSHACALTVEGKAYCWGGAELGTGSSGTSPIPVAVDTTYMTGAKTFVQVDAGNYSACGIATDGLLYCWGDNYYGQLGTGSANPSESSPMPVDMTNVTTPHFSDVAVGYGHACAISVDGKAYCWGRDTDGQLGDGGVATNSDIPVAVDVSTVTGDKAFIDVSLQGQTSCAITSAGVAYCWGYSFIGEGGRGSTGSSQSPQAITTTSITGSTKFTKLGSGDNHTCAVKDDGGMACWGWNQEGALGRGSYSSSTTLPANVDTSTITGSKTFVSVDGGYMHTCATMSDGAAYCFGENEYGEFGTGATSSYETLPVAVPTASLSGEQIFAAISAGYQTTCGLASDGTLYCWGNDSNGIVGEGAGSANLCNTSTACVLSPAAVDMTNVGSPTSLRFTSIANGSHHSCGIAADGKAYCWGSDVDGQIGDGPGSPSVCNTNYACATGPTAVDTSGMTGAKTFQQLAGGYDHTCGLSTDGIVYCWGGDNYGQLGNYLGGATDKPTPVDLGGIAASRFKKIGAGEFYNCALATTSQVYCWGSDQYGRLGDGGVEATQTRPTFAVDLTGVTGSTTIVDLSVGFRHACALKSDGRAVCWGTNDKGQLGNGTTVNAMGAVNVSTASLGGVTSFLTIGAGGQTSCGTTASGATFCWGNDDMGGLGNGAGSPETCSSFYPCSTTPVAIDTSGMTGSTSMTLLSGSLFTSCGLAGDGKAYCWAMDQYGQLGDSLTDTTSDSPVQVSTAPLVGDAFFKQVSGGYQHVCGLTGDGRAYCWGYNYYGGLGDGTTTDQWVAVPVASP